MAKQQENREVAADRAAQERMDRAVRQLTIRDQQYPQLLIGCGGTGCDVVLKIVRLWNPNWALRIVLIDSDPNTLNQKSRELVEKLKIPQANILTIQLGRELVLRALQNPRINEQTYMPILKSGGIARQNQDGKWEVDTRLQQQAIARIYNVEAAQQTPSYSRMMFFARREDITRQISGILAELLNLQDRLIRDDEGRVLNPAQAAVFGSAFGGTGAGIVLPIMFAVKDRCDPDARPVKISLYLFDSSFAHDDYFNPNEAFLRRATVNELVCERELDIVQQGLQEITDEDANPVGDYLFPELTRNLGANPAHYKYDRVFLINRNQYGGQGRNGRFEDAKASVAQTFVEISRLQRSSDAMGTFDQDPFEADWDGYRCEITNAKRNYCSLASSCVKYPRKDVIRYLKYASLADLYPLALTRPSDDVRTPDFPVYGQIFTAVENRLTTRAEEYRRRDVVRRFDLNAATGEMSRVAGNATNELYGQFIADFQRFGGEITSLISNACNGSFATADKLTARTITMFDVELQKLDAELRIVPDQNSVDSSVRIARQAVDRRNNAENRNVFLDAVVRQQKERVKREILVDLRNRLQHVKDFLKDTQGRCKRRHDSLDKMCGSIQRKAEELRNALIKHPLVTPQWLDQQKKDINELLGLLNVPNLVENLVGYLTGVLRLEGAPEGERVDVVNANIEQIKKIFSRGYGEFLPQNVVSFLLGMNQQDREAIVRVAFGEARPAFNCPAHHGMAINHPISRCFCVAPKLPQGQTYPEEFETCFSPQHLQLERAEGRGARIVPCSDNPEDLILVHIVTGLRPNYSADFTEKKNIYLRMLQERSLGIVPTPIERLEWYNEKERTEFPRRNPNDISYL